MKSLRILMFAPWFPPHRNSEAIVTGKLALTLLKKGIKLDVVAAQPIDIFSYYEEQDIWQPLKSITHHNPLNKMSYLSLFKKRLQGISLSGHPVKGITWVQYAIDKGLELAAIEKYDLILSRSQPSEGHLPAMVLSQKLKLPWITNWNDLEPACKAPEPYGDGFSAKSTFFFERYLRSVISSALHHTFPSERSRQYMGKIYPTLLEKSSVIPHVALNYTMLGDCSLTDKSIFTVCHAGTFDGRRSPSKFFAGFDAFLTNVNDDSIKLILLGNSYEGDLRFTIPEKLRRHIEIKPWTIYSETLKELTKASILLMIEAPMKEGIYLSGKFVDYVQCRRPILSVSPEVGTLSDFIKRLGGGMIADCSSSEAVEAALLAMYSSWQINKLKSDFNSDKLYDIFSEETVVEAYEYLFSTVCR